MQEIWDSIRNMTSTTKLAVIMGLLVSAMVVFKQNTQSAELPKNAWWNFQSIDTMKYSRDASREYLSKPDELKKISERQITAIAEAGATHVAIATPYDEEFIPILKAWVKVARQHNLHVWFRGNWSGWEGWFEYPGISRDEHITKTVAFIKKHPELFEPGDIFSACPECENGGPGDPRMNGDVVGHRAFLIKEHQAIAQAFEAIGKPIQHNFNSMNGDVAKLIMDPVTTKALGGLVVVDHYVSSPEKLNQDITDLAKRSGGKVVLGEFGAPIPDIHGTMSEVEQAAWIKQSLNLLATNTDLVGINYWTSVGGSTAVWSADGHAKPAVAILKQYFTPQSLDGTITNLLGNQLDQATITVAGRAFASSKGNYRLNYLQPDETVTISLPGYESQNTTVSELQKQPNVVLVAQKPNWWFRLRAWIKAKYQN